MATPLTDAQARRIRLIGQRLETPVSRGPDATAEVCRAVSGLQAQDIFAASLGVRVRSNGVTLAAVEQARFVTKSVVWTWAMRGTLHLVATDDLGWMLAALGQPMIRASAGRRMEIGLDEDTYQRGLAVARNYLAGRGPSTRKELGAALHEAGLPAGYSVERHLLHRAALEGVVCMGPDRGAEPTFVLLEGWLGRPLQPVEQEQAVSMLVSRYLGAFAPASLADLATWSGLPMAALRPAWETLTAGMDEVIVRDRPAWIARQRLASPGATPDFSPHVCLLPAFDTYLLGHRDRSLILDPAYAHQILAGGIIKGALLVDGAVAGVWQPNRKGRRLRITVEPFAPLAPAVRERVAEEIADTDRFLGVSSRS